MASVATAKGLKSNFSKLKESEFYFEKIKGCEKIAFHINNAQEKKKDRPLR